MIQLREESPGPHGPGSGATDAERERSELRSKKMVPARTRPPRDHLLSAQLASLAFCVGRSAPRSVQPGTFFSQWNHNVPPLDPIGPPFPP